MYNIKYVCVQPRLVYYAWQIEVMLNSFIKHGVDMNNVHILVAFSLDQNDKTNQIDVIELFDNLVEKYSDVKFFFYKDIRILPNYISSIRPNILKQHFSNYPELENDAIFYHDCDIVFTKKPNFEKFLNDNIWYLSNTISYIGAKYVLSKGEEIYLKMCNIVGIDPEIPKLNEDSSGGAQYLIKGVNSNFWEKVENDSEKLYRFFLIDEPQKVAMNPSYHPIQKWTSDMWALLWNAWYFGYQTKVDSHFDFTWATDPIEKWDQNLIYHNAGVVGIGELFFKGSYINTLPYFIENEFNQKFASYKYYQEIVQTGKDSCLKLPY